jgi:hypothetical protein
MINNKWQKKRKHQSLSLSVPLFLSLYLLFNLSNVNQKNDKKNPFWWEREICTAVLCIYVRSPIDNYENKEQTKWWSGHLFRLFVLSLCDDYTVISHLFFCFLFRCVQTTDRHSPAMIILRENEKDWHKVLPITIIFNRHGWTRSS